LVTGRNISPCTEVEMGEDLEEVAADLKLPSVHSEHLPPRILWKSHSWKVFIPSTCHLEFYGKATAGKHRAGEV